MSSMRGGVWTIVPFVLAACVEQVDLRSPAPDLGAPLEDGGGSSDLDAADAAVLDGDAGSEAGDGSPSDVGFFDDATAQRDAEIPKDAADPPRDAMIMDAAALDAAALDAAALDAAALDAAALDAAALDAEPALDALPPDGDAPRDAAPLDAAPLDAGGATPCERAGYQCRPLRGLSPEAACSPAIPRPQGCESIERTCCQVQ
jgi:hypothetical protein